MVPASCSDLHTIGSLGLYSHGEDVTEGGRKVLDLKRRFAFHKSFLELVLASGPQPEVAWDAEEVGRSIDAVSELGRQRTQGPVGGGEVDLGPDERDRR